VSEALLAGEVDARREGEDYKSLHDFATLAGFSQQQGCDRRGRRWDIRIHFDRDCSLVRGAHSHRICPCGHRWIECRPRSYPIRRRANAAAAPASDPDPCGLHRRDKGRRDAD